jgi:D-alanyl-D-alanine carboxypeptidase/D-alanyl-D-alanine-endopeptidase (penicillin-binding protein 4)
VPHPPRMTAILPLLTTLAVLGLSFERAMASPLSERLDDLMRRPPLAGAAVGLLVVRAADGSEVYAHGADRLLIPASNQKILTALASLARFGPAHRFTTRVWSRPEPGTRGRVEGLLLEGGGDPVMNSEDWWRVASDLKGEGLRLVAGDLRVDDSLFESPGWHPSWGRISARAYHAPVGALTANYGTFFVSIWPNTRPGVSARVAVDPPVDYLRIHNRAKTASASAQPKLIVDRARGRREDGFADEVVRVDGAARLGDGVDRFPRSVLDPGLYAGSLLVHQLAAHGVDVEGAVRRSERGSEEGDESLVLLLERPGRTLAEVVQLCMKYSNNAIAESLVKSLGAWDGAASGGDPLQQGGWSGGVKALRGALAAQGVELGEARIVDGSGLSLQNRISPRMLVEVLRVGSQSFRFGPEFVASFPIAELDGTLEKRLEGGRGRVRAKTGLLSDADVTALSGYAERNDGERLVFSILVNGHSGSSSAAMEAVDALARNLLEFSIEEDTAR